MDRNLLDGLNPVTQTIESGKALAKFLGLSEELPESIALANGARLTLNSKKDCYYYTSDKNCSCKAGQYGRICKHRKALETGSSTRLFAKPGVSFNLPEDGPKASSQVSRMLIDAYAFETKPGELEYWHAKQQAQEA